MTVSEKVELEHIKRKVLQLCGWLKRTDDASRNLVCVELRNLFACLHGRSINVCAFGVAFASGSFEQLAKNLGCEKLRPQDNWSEV